jgi:hypothetical protein
MGRVSQDGLWCTSVPKVEKENNEMPTCA